MAAAAVLVAAWPVYALSLRPQPDGRALVARAVSACDGCTAVYVGATKRLFERYAPPGFPAYRRRNIEAIRLDLEAWDAGGAVFATDEVAGAVRFPPAADLGSGRRLYRIDPAALR